MGVWLISFFLKLSLACGILYWFFRWPSRKHKLIIFGFFLFVAWFFLGNIALIDENGSWRLYFHPFIPLRTGYGCQSFEKLFLFIWRKVAWC